MATKKKTSEPKSRTIVDSDVGRLDEAQQEALGADPYVEQRTLSRRDVVQEIVDNGGTVTDVIEQGNDVWLTYVDEGGAEKTLHVNDQGTITSVGQKEVPEKTTPVEEAPE